MGAMRITYDAVGDMLFVEFKEPSDDAEIIEAGDGVLVSMDPRTREVFFVEVWTFQRRLGRGEDVNVTEIINAFAALPVGTGVGG